MKIILWPDPRLKRVSDPFLPGQAPNPPWVTELYQTMEAAGGLGLSAIQVGSAQRIFISRVAGERRTFVNPAWEPAGKGEPTMDGKIRRVKVAVQEGCLSTPGQFETVLRFPEVRCIYLNENMEPQELEAKGLLAQVIQHECEHLDGKMFVDHLNSADRSRIMGTMMKFKRSGKR